MNDFNKFTIFKFIIYLIVSVLGIIAFFRTCGHEKRIEELKYNLIAVEHQPRLVFSEKPKIVKTILKNVIPKPISDIPYSYNIDIVLIVKVKISITNIDKKSLGKIILLASTTRDINVKDYITGKYTPDNLKQEYHELSEFETSQLLPNETIEHTSTFTITKPVNSKYMMNFIILYQNEFGNLYHTNVKVPFEFKPIQFNININNTLRGRKITTEQFEKMARASINFAIASHEFIKPLEPVSYYDIYSKNETELALDHLEKSIPKESDNK